MDKTQKVIIVALISTSAIAWVASIQQPDMMMMTAMITYNPLAISLFTASWTVGMAAMMLPAITPIILIYNTFLTSRGNNRRSYSITIHEESKPKLLLPLSSVRLLMVILFIGSYLLIWALVGLALLLGWSVLMNNIIMTTTTQRESHNQLLASIYGAVLVIAGAYQFTPLKRTCIGYCESPMSFFMRRWKDGAFGAIRMGIWHGTYCLGCCWAYFILMVALGWMNLLWMGLFAGIIFGEKMWSKGIWVARAAGAGLVIIGILVIAGMLPSLVGETTPAISSSRGMVSSMSGVHNNYNMSESNGVAGSDSSKNNKEMTGMNIK